MRKPLKAVTVVVTRENLNLPGDLVLDDYSILTHVIDENNQRLGRSTYP
jgi:hypothetical protein